MTTKFTKKWLWALLPVALATGAAGVLTNGVPPVPLTSTFGNYFQIMGTELIPVDTGLANGQNPQSVAASPAQIAALSVCFVANTATLSSKAATLSTQCGSITTESLTTAVNATDTATITDTMVAATSTVQCGMWLKSATAGRFQVQSIVPAAGSYVVTFKNVGTAAINGTGILGCFQL